MQDRHTAVDHPGEDLGLGIGDFVDAGEMLEVNGRHGGDERDVRADLRHQRGDLAGVVHADLEDAEARAGRHAGERQRHTPVVVEGGGRGVRLAGIGHHQRQAFLGAGLAHRPGDGDDAALAAGARRHPEPLERG